VHGVALLSVGTLLGACGGTTGREGDPAPTASEVDATVAGDAGLQASVEASVIYDAALFDVNIQYAPFPDVAPREEAGASSAGDSGEYPNCPPWLPVDGMGNVLDADTLAYTFVPTEYTPDAGVVAADGGPCATYAWLTGYDLACVAYQNSGDNADPFPPCNWAVGLGNAQAGPAAGSSRYDLCMSLYTCIQNSGCWRPHPGISGPVALRGCFCGPADGGQDGCAAVPPNPTGDCHVAIEDAFEVPDLSSSSVKAILNNYEVDLIPNFASMNLGLTAPDYASALLNVYSLAAQAIPSCVVDAGSD
jgi:hypothetical protein